MSSKAVIELAFSIAVVLAALFLLGWLLGLPVF